MIGSWMFLPQAGWAQGNPATADARANGLAGATVCLADAWSTLNNVGALGDINTGQAGFSQVALPGFPMFNRVAAVVVAPTRLGTAGVGAYRFGDELYREDIVSAAYGNRIGMTALGARVNYIQYNARGAGRRGIVTISLGGLARLTTRLRFGAFISSIQQPRVSPDGERLPTQMSAGMLYNLSTQVAVMGEVEKDTDFPARLKVAMEYQPYTRVAFRTGFHTQPAALYFGTGFRMSRLQCDYAYRYQPAFAAQHVVTASVRLGRKPS